jgi:hypothetical protein
MKGRSASRATAVSGSIANGMHAPIWMSSRVRPVSASVRSMMSSAHAMYSAFAPIDSVMRSAIAAAAAIDLGPLANMSTGTGV